MLLLHYNLITKEKLMANEKKKKDSNESINICKFLTFILRHKPFVAKIQLDENGFAEIDKVLLAVKKIKNIDIDEQKLSSIIKRFANKILEIKDKKIRAKFGHSVILNMNVPSGFVEIKDIPHTLFSIIDSREMWSIMSSGLKPSNLKSNFVSDNARLKPLENMKIIKIDSEKASKSSNFYYDKDSNTYFCKFVPSNFISYSI